MEIGAGGSQSPFLNAENIGDYKEAHIIRTDLWAGNESEDDRKEMEKKYGGFGASGNLLQAEERDEKRISRSGDEFKGKIDYLKCEASQLPLEDESF